MYNIFLTPSVVLSAYLDPQWMCLIICQFHERLLTPCSWRSPILICADVRSGLSLQTKSKKSNNSEHCEKLPSKRKIGHCSAIPATCCRPFHESVSEPPFPPVWVFVCTFRKKLFQRQEQTQHKTCFKGKNRQTHHKKHGSTAKTDAAQGKAQWMAITLELARTKTRRSR